MRKIHIWILPYFVDRLAKILKTGPKKSPQHILFCFVDHFEPGWNKADLILERLRVDGWIDGYPKFALKFKDADGYHPRHTWFYPPHYFREEHIKKLKSLCKKGFGEIEMHLHHSRMEPFPDTPQTLKKKILDCVSCYSKYGIFRVKIGGKVVNRYAFIHGDWALDNSRPEFCGINSEISILNQTGCYADFTFPAYMVESQPKMINTVYYASDNPDRPKSYNRGVRVKVGRKSRDSDLLMIQGPLGFRFKRGRKWFMPSVDDGEIACNNQPSTDRVDLWVKLGVHVCGRPEWIIVKVFTHGAPLREHDTLLRQSIISMHKHLQKKYNDGNNYCLHYVSARELYNIIKAAEYGKTGNPGQYRNFIIGQYDYL